MDTPRLRPGLALARTPDNQIVLHDPMRVGEAIVVSYREIEIAKRLNGTTIDTLLSVASRPEIESLFDRLNAALLLDNDAFRQFLTQEIRPYTCFSRDPATVPQLHSMIDSVFTSPGGPGRPTDSPGSPVRAVLVPHMDYPRGNITYGHGFKTLLERTTASTFLIVATSHYSPVRFSLTRMHFDTPFGTVPTDRNAVNRIVELHGDESMLFGDPLAHFPEHSIELEVVLLKALIDRPIKIVPVLCGSFHDAVEQGRSPGELPDVARMINALKTWLAETKDDVCVIISGDLAHIGPKFGDPQPVNPAILKSSLGQDERLLDSLMRGDAESYYRTIAAENDERRICGLPPTYLALNILPKMAGDVRHYQQFIHPQGYESVSFASVAWA